MIQPFGTAAPEVFCAPARKAAPSVARPTVKPPDDARAQKTPAPRVAAGWPIILAAGLGRRRVLRPAALGSILGHPAATQPLQNGWIML
jgi:hypothetical protein